MNVADLEDELDRQAVDSPAAGDIRAVVKVGVAARVRRRRTVSLLATAAAVVVIAGGIGMVAALRNNSSIAPVTPPPGVVRVPDIEVGPGSALVPLSLTTVTSPVSVQNPDHLAGPAWQQSAGRLTVIWYDPAHPPQALSVGTDQSAAHSRGYVISVDASEPVFDATGAAVTPVSTTTDISGRPAELRLAPAGSVDALGNPASARLSWQLTDGRWIHVWAQDASEEALTAFAADIIERPDVLRRDLGIGLTLPGYIHDSVWNASTVSMSNPDVLYLCTPGTDGLALSIAGNLAGAPCLMITARAQPADPGGVTTTVPIAGVSIRVSVANQVGYRSLASGGSISVALLGGPTLSAADLAALTASATVDPSVTFDPSLGNGNTPTTGPVISTR